MEYSTTRKYESNRDLLIEALRITNEIDAVIFDRPDVKIASTMKMHENCIMFVVTVADENVEHEDLVAVRIHEILDTPVETLDGEYRMLVTLTN